MDVVLRRRHGVHGRLRLRSAAVDHANRLLLRRSGLAVVILRDGSCITLRWRRLVALVVRRLVVWRWMRLSSDHDDTTPAVRVGAITDVHRAASVRLGVMISHGRRRGTIMVSMWWSSGDVGVCGSGGRRIDVVLGRRRMRITTRALYGHICRSRPRLRSAWVAVRRLLV